MNYSLVNSPNDYSHLLRYSPETPNMLAEISMLLFHWRKHSNEHSKFPGYILCATKTPNPVHDKHGE